jgi:hypothetical protein
MTKEGIGSAMHSAEDLQTEGKKLQSVAVEALVLQIFVLDALLKCIKIFFIIPLSRDPAYLPPGG